MKRPVLTVTIASFTFMFVLLLLGMMTSGDTKITQSVTLKGSPDRVWPFFADLQGWPVWYHSDGPPRMTMSVLTEGTLSGINSVRHAEDSNGFWWQERVTAFEPNKRLELTGVKTEPRHNWRQEIVLEPLGKNQTKVTWTIQYSVNGPINKLLNKGTAEEEFSLVMDRGLKNIEPLIPSEEEWGEPDAPAVVPTAAPAVLDPKPDEVKTGAGGH